MKNFDLNAYGVSEMSEAQTRDVNGGIIAEILAIIAITGAIYAAGYALGQAYGNMTK